MAQPANDFLSWHTEKERINNSKEEPYFYERDVWWCSVGLNVGHEENGKGIKFSRPVLVFKKFNTEMFWGIPLSTNKRKGGIFFLFSFLPNIISNGLLSQLRIFDSKRLVAKMGSISENDFCGIKKAIKNLI